MFLFQKLKYDYKHLDLNNVEEFKKEIDYFIRTMINENPEYVCFDTETDGLNIMKAKPFLVSIGFNKMVRTFDYNPMYMSAIWKMLEASGILIKGNCIGLGAHNCKFDYHMVENGGSKIPDSIPLFDSITIARLTEYADDKESMSLESLGGKYVDNTAKFAGGVIKSIIKKLNKKRRDELCSAIMEAFPNDGYFTTTSKGTKKSTSKLTELLHNYDKSRTQFLNDDDLMFKFIDEHYTPANYKDVYEIEPDLMRNYAADDIVIMLEYLRRAVPALRKVDKNLVVLKREGDLIKVVAQMEKTGLKVDVDYILNCRKEIVKYRELLYFELFMMTGVEFTVGQHDFIKKLLKDKYNIKANKSDEKALKYIKDKGKGEVVDFVTNILELRTIDKWLSTYIDGKLNAIVNGRIHTDMNNNGAVSGRISCDMQQQPKEPLYDGKKVRQLKDEVNLGFVEEFSDEYYEKLKEAELFHPRQMFVADEGYSLFFIDESQMELRVQAFYTILTSSEPDYNMCRAYMPYKCWHYQTKEEFDFTKPEHLKRWKDLRSECPPLDTFKEGLKDALKQGWSVWEDETGFWKPTDLHSETTHHAFPSLDMKSKEFKKKRKLGKVANFLKVYQGGVLALMESLEVDRKTAENLDSAFYKAFPRIRDYQDWVTKQASLYGYVENLYGRRYYMNNRKWFYKLCNYLIQGTCADMVKGFEIRIHNFLKENDYKTKMVFPIHDEIIFLVPNGEEHIVSKLKGVMEDTYNVIKNIPMVAEVECSKTNWREKKEWKYENT